MEKKPSAINRAEVTENGSLDDIISSNNFEMNDLIIELTSQETLIPTSLPNIIEGRNPRLRRKNEAFIKNYVGLCVWKHMNGGDCWVTKLSFSEKKNPGNIAMFQQHIDSIRINHPSLWKKMTPYGNELFTPNKLCSFCANNRNIINKKQFWNKDSDNTEGMYDKFKLMLDKINFPLA